MTWIAVLIKFRDVAYLAVILLLFTYTQVLEKNIAQDKVAQAKALSEALAKAESLSNELIIEQAAAMGRTNQKVISYVTRIRNVPGPSVACDDERMRIGSRGVFDIISGSGPKAGGGADGGQLPAASVGAGPR